LVLFNENKTDCPCGDWVVSNRVRACGFIRKDLGACAPMPVPADGRKIQAARFKVGR
jgi:hypothetical protein